MGIKDYRVGKWDDVVMEWCSERKGGEGYVRRMMGMMAVQAADSEGYDIR